MINNKLEELISEKDILNKVLELGSAISSDFKDKELVIVSVLKGSFIFTADLVRHIDIPIVIGFIAASSYGESTISSGKLVIQYDIDVEIKGKHVVIVEDIIDTGLTIAEMKEYLENRGALSVKVCTIFDKPERRKVDVHIDYTGFVIPNEFVVGYGLDYNNPVSYTHLTLPTKA